MSSFDSRTPIGGRGDSSRAPGGTFQRPSRERPRGSSQLPRGAGVAGGEPNDMFSTHRSQQGDGGAVNV
jgi:hypothetical protein